MPNTKEEIPEMVGALDLKDMTTILIKHYGLHDGLYDLGFEFQIAIGAVGPDEKSAVPGAMFGIKRIGIAKTEKAGVLTVDASEVNPATTIKKLAPKKPTTKSTQKD